MDRTKKVFKKIKAIQKAKHQFGYNYQFGHSNVNLTLMYVKSQIIIIIFCILFK